MKTREDILKVPEKDYVYGCYAEPCNGFDELIPRGPISREELFYLCYYGHIDLENHINDSPKVEDFLAFMVRWPQVKALADVVPLKRPDCRIQVVGLYCDNDITEDLKKAFTQFDQADEYCNQDGMLRAWYD